MAEPNIEYLEHELGTLEVRPGDAIVVRFKSRVPQPGVAMIRKSLQRVFPDNRCVVLCEGAEIGVMREAQETDNDSC